MKNTIKQHTRLGLILVILFAGLITASLYYIFSINAAEKELKVISQQETATLANLLSVPLWNFDSDSIGLICSALLKTPRISGIEIIDHNKQVVFEGSKMVASETIQFTEKIRHKGDVIGSIAVDFSKRVLEEGKEDILLTAFLMVLVIAASSIFLMELMLNRTLFIPLRQLQENIELFSKGRYQTLKVPAEKEEVQVILSSFDSLVQKLSSKERELLAHHDHLEAVVKERTDKYREQVLVNKTITDNASSCLFMMDRQGYPTFMNPAAERVTGYTLDEIRWKPLHDAVHYKYPDGSPYPISECPIDNAQAELKKMVDYEDTFVRKDGSLYPVICYIEPLEKDGELIGSVLEFQETTERKQAEEQFKASQAQVMHMEKLTALGKLTGSIAHEFNNPLQGVRSVIENLEGSGLTEDEAELAKMGKKECDRMARLIQGLRDFCKPSLGEVSRIDISECIEGVLVLTEKIMQKKRIIVKKNFSESLPKIDGIKDQIEQVILNIIMNSIDAISGGEATITVTTEQQGPEAIVKIHDTGVGISEDNQKKLFEPFFSTKGEGSSGLGLSISHGIIKEHGGNIQVESAPGEGSVFVLNIPINRVQPTVKSKGEL